MNASHSVTDAPTELIIERVFNAPRERVFDMFTTAEHLRKWWGPKLVSVPVAEYEARPGGRMFFGERGPDGAMRYMVGVVREIERPSRIVFAIHFTNERKERVPPPVGAGLPTTWAGEIVAAVTLVAERERTRVILRQSLASVTPEWGEGARAGWGQSLDRLAQALADD